MNVLLTTFEIVLRDSKELGDIKWQVLAVDEVCFSSPLCLGELFCSSAYWHFLGTMRVRVGACKNDLDLSSIFVVFVWSSGVPGR